jgi:hypothetical protein
MSLGKANCEDEIAAEMDKCVGWMSGYDEVKFEGRSRTWARSLVFVMVGTVLRVIRTAMSKGKRWR